MLDLKLIRDNPAQVREGLQKRGDAALPSFEELLRKDAEYRKGMLELEKVRHEKRKASDEVGQLKREGKSVQEHLDRLKKVSDAEDKLSAVAAQQEAEIQRLLLGIPNIPHPSIPVGTSEKNQVIRTWGEIREPRFKPLSHLELIEKLKLVDLGRAAKISGSHFLLFTGMGARLERALIQFMLDLHTQEHRYLEISPPYLVNRASMTGTGQLPKFEEEMYRLKDDDLFLIPTAEVPVTNLHSGEILEGGLLPRYYAAYSACFRREAGSYGSQTKGMIRVHQFDKVELVKLVAPESSYDELEGLVNHAEQILQRLELPYRVVMLASGDLGFSAAKCYDLEAWAPGMNGWLEVSSCSNFEDFQARRANIRYREAATKKVRYVHTLNGSGVALARTVVALLEVHQNSDGSVTIPQALRPYLDGLEKLTAL